MRFFHLIIFITLLTVGCTINNYRLWDDVLTEPKGPKNPDYSISDSGTKFIKDLIYLKAFAKDSSIQFINFWKNGNCMLSGAYKKLNLDSICCIQFGYRGKYELTNDTLKTEFFVGGNPQNEYLMYRYIVSGDTMIFVDVKFRTPGKLKWRTRKWMQEKHNRNLIKVPNQRMKPINWEATW